MSLVQNMVVLSPRELCSEAVDGLSFRSIRNVDRIDDKLVRPMPRRVQSFHFSVGEPAKPFLHLRSLPSSTLDCEASLELLEILRSKNPSVNPTSFGCSTPFFSGSPPARTRNPIVRDVEFLQSSIIPSPHATMCPSNIVKDVESTNREQEVPSQITCYVKPSVSPRIYSASPRVRVEGFECPNYAFDHTSRDTHRQVAAIA